MVTMIEDRRVTDIPMELESHLKLEACCATCGKTASATDDEALRKCSNCKIVVYCCKECQAQDWERHKTEDQCVAIKKLRRRLDKAERNIRAHKSELLNQYELEFGTEAFMGREAQLDYDIFDIFRNQDLDVFEMLAGRFGGDQYTREYFSALGELVDTLRSQALRHQTLALWEERLEMHVEMKRLTHVNVPYALDTSVTEILVKLNREDDAISYVRHWAKDYARLGGEEYHDSVVSNSSKGEYPYPCESGCRLDSIMPCIETCCREMMERTGHVESSAIITFCMTSLVIKLRHVTVYRNLAERSEVFLNSPVGQWLPSDIDKAIVSFLTLGDEGALLYTKQLKDIDILMDFIDEEYPAVPRVILDPTLPPRELNVPVRKFLTHGVEAKVIETLKGILKERYR